MDGSQGSASSKSRSLSKLRVLMQMRDNALTHRGGDTVVMERLTDGLRALGHTVDVDLLGERDPGEYDLVHLYNFCTPAITERFARNAVARNTPFVVTTMYEDWPLFFNQMAATYMVMERYVQLGQPQAYWDQMISSIKNLPVAETQKNEFTGAHASALFPTGVNERDVILRDYPHTKRVEIYHCGAQVQDKPGDPDLFRKEYGLKDFVLCVGRLEWRKNQLMIMKALEESDLDLVFLTGGFTYQPEYDAVMRQFRRRGKTHFIGKVSADMLSSAFAASRCHVLPSWYELPGLVSIEAAHAGTNVVVTDYGTIRDYVGDDAFYCAPDDAHSVNRAIVNAYEANRNPQLQERVSRFTWENATKENLAVYEKILSEYGYVKESALPAAWQQPAMAIRQVESAPSPAGLCDAGDRAARAGEINTAEESYRDAIIADPTFLRAHRGLAVLSLSAGKWEEAEGLFHAVLMLHPADTASKAGLATSRWNLGQREEAFKQYAEILNLQPDHAATLTYFISACYELQRYTDLSMALERYLQLHPESTDMMFALAGAYLKEGRIFAGKTLIESIERRNPTYPGLPEMHQLFESGGSVGFTKQAQPLSTPALSSLAQSAPKQELSPISGFQVTRLGPTDFPSGQDKGAVALKSTPVTSALTKVSDSTYGQEIEIHPPTGSDTFPTEILRLDEFLRKKEYTQALDLSARLLGRADLPSAERAYVGILAGEAHACRGDLISADTEFRKYDTHPQYGFRAVTGKGIVAAERGRWEEAEAFFRHALSMNPKHDVAVAGIAMALTQQGDQEGAWNEYNRALELNPENMRAILGVIDLGYRLGRLSAVQRVIESYLEYNPANLSMLYAHAGCLYAQGEQSLARTQLEKIKLFEPRHELANELIQKIETESGPELQRVFSAAK